MAFLFLVLLSVEASSQITVKGTVYDSASRQPLPFVNIGVRGQNLGTVSLQDGKFELTGLSKGQKLLFSMVGYKSTEIDIQSLQEEIFLAASNTRLQEVVVKSSKLKKGFLGNRTSSKLINGGFSVDFLGAEAGVPIRAKKTETFINTFHFFIARNDYDSLRFRVNIYELRNNEVGKRILNHNVIIENASEGWNNVNLEPYDVKAEGDFMVSLEWLTDFPCNKSRKDENGEIVDDCYLRFSATLFKKHIFYRAVSQGEFRLFTGGSLGFLVGVEH